MQISLAIPMKIKMFGENLALAINKIVVRTSEAFSRSVDVQMLHRLSPNASDTGILRQSGRL